MAILLDTGFYFALIASKDLFHDRAREIWQEISTGKYGRTYTTDYVLDEVFTLLNVRTHGKRKDLLMKLKDFFLGNEPIATLIKIEISWLNEIAQIQYQATIDNDPMSFTDAANIIVAKKIAIPQIISFDKHYEGFLKQIR